MKSTNAPKDYEKRKQIRIKKRWPIIVFRDGKELSGQIKNITTAGMFITCRQQLRQNEVCKISVMPPQHETIVITCTVVWSNHIGPSDVKKSFGMGVSFVSVSEKDLEILSSLL